MSTYRQRNDNDANDWRDRRSDERAGEDRRSGYAFEEDVLYPKGDPRRAIAERLRGAQTVYRDLHSSILTSIHPSNPLAYSTEESWTPRSKAMSLLHLALVKRLGVQNYQDLRIFPCLRTAADRYHQIDFVILYHDEASGQNVMVTVDITKNPDKEPRLEENWRQGRNKFEADMLYTERGAYANPLRFQGLDPRLQKALAPGANTQQRELQELLVCENQARMIVDIIEEKLKCGEQKYRELLVRTKIFDILHEWDVREKKLSIERARKAS